MSSSSLSLTHKDDNSPTFTLTQIVHGSSSSSSSCCCCWHAALLSVLPPPAGVRIKHVPCQSPFVLLSDLFFLPQNDLISFMIVIFD